MSKIYLSYPLGLGTREDLMHWVEFQAFLFPFNKKKLHFSCAMYIPPDALQTSYKAEYETAALGMVLGGAKAGAAKAQGKGGANAASMEAANMAVAKAGSAEAMAAGAIKAAGLAGQGAQQAMELETGYVINPYIVAAYKGPQSFREHQYSFVMTPESPQESRAVTDIVQKFKASMLPSQTGGDNKIAPSGVFGYPDEFLIDYTINGNPLPKNNSNPIFNIGRSVLTDCSLDYTTQDQALFFDGNQNPATVSMKLTFMEIEVITREKIAFKGL